LFDFTRYLSVPEFRGVKEGVNKFQPGSTVKQIDKENTNRSEVISLTGIEIGASLCRT
jgi:hypothetical protein